MDIVLNRKLEEKDIGTINLLLETAERYGVQLDRIVFSEAFSKE